LTLGRALGSWLGLLGFATSACALAGYDFDDYERAEPKATSEPTAVGGDPSTSVPFDVTLSTTTAAAGGEKPDDGADARDGAGASATSSGGDAATRADTAEAGAGAGCRPQTCFELGLECGSSPPLPNSCGMPVDCGACFWWFQECRQNRCVIPE
jgi:hypothetical protein